MIVDPTSVVGPIFKISGLYDRASIQVVGDSSLRAGVAAGGSAFGLRFGLVHSMPTDESARVA